MNDTTSNARALPFEFNGKAGEYFGIWIVNILLTILTLGFYTPWAKVRTRRYFYGCTSLDNSTFEYTANPWAIFKGYLIALLFFILYSIGTQFFPPLVLILLLVFFVALPWLVVRSMMFNNYNSMFRNLRFSFKKDYKGAIAVFIGWPLLIPFTLGLIGPYVQFRQNKFFVENSGFGTSEFKFHATPGDFYLIFVKMIGLMMIPSVLIAIIGIIAAIAIPAYNEYLSQAQGTGAEFIQGYDDEPSAMLIFMMIGMYIGMLVLYLAAFVYMQVRTTNLIWNNVEFVTNRFASTMRFRDMMWIVVSNIAAIIISFGLLIPWTKVRVAKYRASKLNMLAVTDLDGFIKYEQDQVGATGDEIGEMFDVDIGL